MYDRPYNLDMCTTTEELEKELYEMFNDIAYKLYSEKKILNPLGWEYLKDAYTLKSFYHIDYTKFKEKLKDLKVYLTNSNAFERIQFKTGQFNFTIKMYSYIKYILQTASYFTLLSTVIHAISLNLMDIIKQSKINYIDAMNKELLDGPCKYTSFNLENFKKEVKHILDYFENRPNHFELCEDFYNFTKKKYDSIIKEENPKHLDIVNQQLIITFYLHMNIQRINKECRKERSNIFNSLAEE